jgi:uncharacterized LabA/DUF88 family protein
VADKKRIKRNIKQLQRVKTWQLVVLLTLAGFLAATFLRLNNIGMIQRRDAVLEADKQGDTNTTQSRLYDLQRYASEHANASTGQFYLEYQYRRDAQNIVSAASQDDNPNGNINAKAEAVCKPQYTVWSQAYVQCFTDELAKYPPSQDPTQKVTLPSVDLYKREYVSPVWSPDFAGWALVVCAAIVAMIIARLVSLGILRILLKRHYRGI